MARVLLVEAGPRVLSAYPEPLSAYAKRALEHLGVEVRLDHAVTGCGAGGVDLGHERIAAANIIWAAGVQASPAGLWLGAKTDSAGRVLVAPTSAFRLSRVFVVGDVSLIRDAAGAIVPGVAPAASRPAPTPPGPSPPGSPASRRRRHSATPTSAAWPPSAARPPRSASAPSA